ncbi:N-acetylmuramoyl-L-alanine amidase [Lysinibacillus sp. NPDC048646]|uniref:N-acetylmuramoyl-L-alanine amidase n=1 Tax=Lysinibacillus sp. NPDC048646 TaxID=3390574 RepID=UPI003D0011BB
MTPRFIWLEERLNQIEKDKNRLIVSIHLNSGGDGSKAIGTEVLYYDQKELAVRIAKTISDATSGGLLNRGAKQRKDLGVLARTYEPAILIEICFVNSTVDAAIYRRDFEKICQAIAKELAAYLGKSPPSTLTSAEDKKEGIKVTQTWNPGSPAMKTETENFIAQAVKDGIIQESHLKDLQNGTMITDRLLGLYITIQQRRS